jgi:hypothetical protein
MALPLQTADQAAAVVVSREDKERLGRGTTEETHHSVPKIFRAAAVVARALPVRLPPTAALTAATVEPESRRQSLALL